MGQASPTLPPPIQTLAVTPPLLSPNMFPAETGSFPEIQDIPPSPPSSSYARRTTIPMPDVIRRLFAQFPLYAWPPAESGETWSKVEEISHPATLYIIPPREPGTWESADPVSLRWQMEFAVRGMPVHCEPLYDAYWSPEHTTPFAQVATESKDMQLLGEASLQRYMDHYYPLARAELEEKSVWPDDVQDEVMLWMNLLEQRVMAGVLLACIRSGTYTPPSQSVSLLRRWLAPLFPGETSPEQRAFARLARLSAAGASPSSLAAVFGRDYLSDVRNPLTLVPGYSVDWVGFLSGTSNHTGPDASEVEQFPASLRVDQVAIQRDAAEALNAVATRLADDTSSRDDNVWMLGARRPTSLDCLLFAVLHTIQTLPADQVRFLLAVRERHPSLQAYYERLHKYVP